VEEEDVAAAALLVTQSEETAEMFPFPSFFRVFVEDVALTTEEEEEDEEFDGGLVGLTGDFGGDDALSISLLTALLPAALV